MVLLNDNDQFWDGSFIGKVNTLSKIGNNIVMTNWKVFFGDKCFEFKLYGNMVNSLTRHYSNNLSMADNFKDRVGLTSTGTICLRFNNSYYTIYRSRMLNGKIIFDEDLKDYLVYRGRNNPFLVDWNLLTQIRKLIIMRLCIFNKNTIISQIKLRYQNIHHNTSLYIRKFLNRNYNKLDFEPQSSLSHYFYPISTVDCNYEIGTGNFVHQFSSLSNVTRNLIFPVEVQNYLRKIWRSRFGGNNYPTLEEMSLIIELFDWRDTNDIITTVNNVSDIIPKDLQNRILNIGMNNIE